MQHIDFDFNNAHSTDLTLKPKSDNLTSVSILDPPKAPIQSTDNPNRPSYQTIWPQRCNTLQTQVYLETYKCFPKADPTNQPNHRINQTTRSSKPTKPTRQTKRIKPSRPIRPTRPTRPSKPTRPTLHKMPYLNSQNSYAKPCAMRAVIE